MKTAALPALVSAHLRVAFKLPLHKRLGAINRILKEAMLYYPECFVETSGNIPLYREPTKFESYIQTLKQPNKETTK